MTDRQDAKLKMYQKVLDVCNENKQEYANVPVFASAVNDLKRWESAILLAVRQQTETNPKGATEDKSSAIDDLTEFGLKIAGPLYVYAFDTKNNTLRVKVNVNKSMFYNIHDSAALTLAKIISAEADANKEVLRNYGVTDGDRSDLDAAIAHLEDLINAPSGVIGERKMYTGNLRELFVAADSIVYDKLDKLIRLFKTLSPDFFTLYGNARNIINTAARKRKSGSEFSKLKD
jgi:hypothetical protein